MLSWLSITQIDSAVSSPAAKAFLCSSPVTAPASLHTVLSKPHAVPLPLLRWPAWPECRYFKSMAIISIPQGY